MKNMTTKEKAISKKDIHELLGVQTKNAEKFLNIQTKNVKELLSDQTTVILDAVGERITNSEVKFDKKLLEVKIEIVNLRTEIDKKLEAMEERWSRKFDQLTTTLDNFLKRMTDHETEFTMMKDDLSRMKKVIKEKLGVEL